MLRIVCGPTGAGKSAIAMGLAERHGLTIISADSRQIYRRFDIGTAKPSAEDQAHIPHCGIDVADPGERWSAARWSEDAVRWIEAVGPDRVVIVGGTGLYLKALTAPFFQEPPLDSDRRAALSDLLGGLGVSDLRKWVEQLDPMRAHLGRTQLLRAAEVALLSGRRLSDLHRDAATQPLYRARWFVVDPADALAPQLEQRIDDMIERGWVEEARMLADEVPADAPAWQACGYAAVRNVALGKTSISEARSTILVGTRQYAKRQRTWFRHQLEGADVTRVDPRGADAEAAADAWWRAEEMT